MYQRAAVSRCLNSPRRMVRAARNAKEIMIPKIEDSGLGDYTRGVGYMTGSIIYEYENGWAPSRGVPVWALTIK